VSENKENHEKQMDESYPIGYVKTYTGEVEKDFGRSGEYREIYIDGHAIFNIFSFLNSGDQVKLTIEKLPKNAISGRQIKMLEQRDPKGNNYAAISIPFDRIPDHHVDLNEEKYRE
jgi:hypothetical protein